MRFLATNIKTRKDLKKYIHNDKLLNTAIKENFSLDVSTWRSKHYKELREMAYPKKEDYLDAVVKDDVDQMNEYIIACKNVKRRFPK